MNKNEAKKRKSEKKRLNSRLNAYQLSLIIISLFISFKSYGSDEKSSVKPENITTVEQTERTSADKQTKALNHCESEVDKRICNTVTKAFSLYYQIANHEPQGSYERDNSMRILSQSIGVTMQSTINEFGDTYSIKMYAAFISFVNLNEKAEGLNLNKDFNEAVSTREKADKHRDEIMDYCKTCLDELE